MAKSEFSNGQTSRMQNNWRQSGQVHFDDNHMVVSFWGCLDSYLKYNTNSIFYSINIKALFLPFSHAINTPHRSTLTRSTIWYIIAIFTTFGEFNIWRIHQATSAYIFCQLEIILLYQSLLFHFYVIIYIIKQTSSIYNLFLVEINYEKYVFIFYNYFKLKLLKTKIDF